ncbi:MAG: hypothetical protein LBI67_07405 [Treponema sp.]|jgi:hypothetical protein|nr:hypothetical protein [Treponema sp.]
MKKLILLLGMVLASGALSAATVSFLIIEAGLPEEDGQSQSSSLWESGMMDVFFEAGHIVSNAPVMRIPDAGIFEKSGEKLPDRARTEFDEAKNGGADYFVMALLEYRGSGLEKPQTVYLRVFSVSNETLLFETSCAGNSRIDAHDEFLEVKKNAEKLVPQLRQRG